MRFGAANFPIVSILEEIDSYAKLGFDYLELAMDPPMAHYSTISADLATIGQALRDNGLAAVCHLPTFVTTADLTESLRRASIEEMHRSLEIAAELGIEKAVLHPSMVTGMGGHVMTTIKALAFDFFAGMVESADRFGVQLCLENMFPRNLFGAEPEDFEEIFTAFPTLKLTLDTGHANIDDWRGDRLMSLVDRLGDRIGHLHFSDNRGRRDEHLAIGEGTVDFRRLVKRLQALGYDDTLTLEVFDADRRKLVASREAIRAMFNSGRPVG